MLKIYTKKILINLRRQIDGLAPTFAKKPSIRQEEDGKRLLFECRIQADPRPTVSWFHNANPVHETPRHKVHTYPTLQTLTRFSYGIFSCEITIFIDNLYAYILATCALYFCMHYIYMWHLLFFSLHALPRTPQFSQTIRLLFLPLEMFLGSGSDTISQLLSPLRNKITFWQNNPFADVSYSFMQQDG